MKTKLKQQTISEYLLNNSMARQAIINGNFNVWQRGTSLVVTSANGVFLADRWREYTNADGGTNPTLTRSRQILDGGDIQNSFYYSRLTTNGAGSAFGVNARHFLVQPIEFGTRYLCGAGKKVTLSFWARSSIANKKIGIRFTQNYGTGGSPSASEVVNGTNWTLTSTWKKYTHTFETNTLSGKTFGTANNDTIEIMFYYVWGDNIKSFVGDSSIENFVGAGNIDIAQVQLCAGEIALPFMPKSYDEELSACQRYYETGRTRFFATGVYIGGSSWFRVNKRVASYTTTFSDALGNANRVSTASGGGSNNLPITGGDIFAVKNTYGFESDALVGASAENWAVFSWKVEAEL